ncbi:hypothetical protein ROZALSC1DRAFT_31730, partial [Rozella allomycis CSF55]
MLAESLSFSNLKSLNLEQSGDSSEISKIDQSQGLNQLFNVLPKTKLVHLKLKKISFSDKFDSITSSKLRTLEVSFIRHHDSQVNIQKFFDTLADLAEMLKKSRLERIAFEFKYIFDMESLESWKTNSAQKFYSMGYFLDVFNKPLELFTIVIKSFNIFRSEREKINEPKLIAATKVESGTDSESSGLETETESSDLETDSIESELLLSNSISGDTAEPELVTEESESGKEDRVSKLLNIGLTIGLISSAV